MALTHCNKYAQHNTFFSQFCTVRIKNYNDIDLMQICSGANASSSFNI